jgi:hypothetical protein
MNTRISNSAVSKYMHCGKSYDLHYNKRIRPIRSHAALNFGSSVDKAIGSLLEGNLNPQEIFDKEWRFQNLNGKETYLPTCIDIVYAESDFDKDLIDKSKLPQFEVTLEEIIQAVSFKEEKGYENIPDEIKTIANIGYWLTLHTKGLLMIEAFRKKILPKLVEVHSTQEKIELENEDGDQIIGYVDIVANVQDHGNVILDVKTAAREYKENSAIYSAQLSLYLNAIGEKYNTRKVGFIVLSKQIIKNKTKICSKCSYDGSEGRAKTCDQESMQIVESKKGPTEKMVRCNGEWNETMKPEAWTQFIVSEMPIQTEELVLENIADINASIKHGIYTKNLSSCLSSFGKPCDYLGLCYEGKMDGLVITEPKV